MNGPIWSDEAEKSVLGACLIDGAEAVIKTFEILRPEMFYSERHKRTFEVMLDMVNADEPIDLMTVEARLRKPSDDSCLNYVMSLTQIVPTAQNIGAYAQEVRTLYTRRQLDRAGRLIAEMAAMDDLTDALAKAEQAIFAISQQGMQPVEMLGAIVQRYWDELYASWDNHGTSGINTGFADLDETLGGMQRGDLIIVAARPSVGKTSLGLQCAMHVARQGGTSLVFSLEMVKDRGIVHRMIQSTAGVDGQAMRTGWLTKDERSKAERAVLDLMQLPVGIDDTPSINTLEMRAKARRFKAEKGRLDLVMIDYLGLVGDSAERGWSKNDAVGETTKRIKAMARELNVPVMLLCQLSRANEKRDDKTPQLSDLRDSGEIEQAADVVLFIHRPEMYRKDDQPGIAKVIVAKQRNGPTGVIELRWHKEAARYQSIARRPEYHENF
jgi:replicative DNA helicase